MKARPPRKPPRPHASALQADLAHRIQQLIGSGEVRAGEHLTEEGLARRYGVSRTPVRQALRLLHQQGLVEVRAHAGTFVAEHAQRRVPAGLVELPTGGEDALYRRILADRAAQALPDTLTEAALIGRYAVARGELRRALVRLARDGLIERRLGHGWAFSPALDTPGAMSESYRFRMLLECGGLREPGFQADGEELQRARAQHLDFIERSRSARPAAMASEFYRMNASFHDMLARFSHNRFIEQAMRQQNQLRRLEEYATFVNRSIDPLDSCREHIEIIDALLAGDVDWAASLLHRHLSVASRR